MYCPKCGAYAPDTAAFCPKCGQQLTVAQSGQPQPDAQQAYQPQYTYQPEAAFDPMQNQNAFAGQYDRPNPAAELKRLFSSGLFLAICILISVSVLLGLAGAGFKLIGILFVISCWMTYANAMGNGPVSSTGYKFSAVILKIQRVLVWITVGLCGFASLILFAMTATASAWISQLNSLITEYGHELSSSIGAEYYNLILRYMSTNSGVTAAAVCATAGVCFLFMCGFLIFYNLFFVNTAIKYADGLTAAAEGRDVVPSGKDVSVRFLVFGVINAVGSLSAFSSTSVSAIILSGLSGAAALIVAYVLLRRN